MQPLETALHYHETTKHYPQRHARSPGYLDWATQPDPFRRYRGAPTLSLLLGDATPSPSYDALYEPGVISSQPVCLESISALLQFSLALSAWKECQGSRWALRINPSSGNLHPTEGYLVAGAVERLAEVPGVFHYAPKDHVLERRCDIRPGVWNCMTKGFPKGTFLAGLSSIHWREAWKYGERAYRYCQHDVGHALAALGLAAALLGWQVQPLTGMSDDAVCMLLGLDRRRDFEHAEREHPDLLIAVVPSAPGGVRDLPQALPNDALESVRCGEWYGSANRLSSDHAEWKLIDTVAEACRKAATACSENRTQAAAFAEPLSMKRSPAPARKIIQQRRSAVAMDGHTRISADQFYLMLDRVLPRIDRLPWRALGSPAHVQLGLFVHLVDGLRPGLYFLVRTPGSFSTLRGSMRDEFDWTKPDGCPPSLPLYHLLSGDVRAVAGQLSCGQDIAATGAFSLGMIAELERSLETHGAWMYRRLFWEAGMIGQVLYLEAEAAGVRGTGIGCYFDDPVHEIFGLEGRKYQSLYHFTVGGPVDDARLTTLPPYPPEVGGNLRGETRFP